MCVTLNEGYLRSANRGSNNIQIFNQNITYQPSMKRQIFLVCLFYCFLDCRSTNLLRLFSGNLPAMFVIMHIILNCKSANVLDKRISQKS